MTGERRLPAVGLVLGAACSVQGGAAVAKSLFPELGPPGVVFLRLLFGSLALWAIARPQIRGRSRADLHNQRRPIQPGQQSPPRRTAGSKNAGTCVAG